MTKVRHGKHRTEHQEKQRILDMSFPMALAVIITSHVMLLVAVILVGAVALDAWVSRKVAKLNRDFQEAYKRHPVNRRPPTAK